MDVQVDVTLEAFADGVRPRGPRQLKVKAELELAGSVWRARRFSYEEPDGETVWPGDLTRRDHVRIEEALMTAASHAMGESS